jgi:hypothetical protein
VVWDVTALNLRYSQPIFILTDDTNFRARPSGGKRLNVI